MENVKFRPIKIETLQFAILPEAYDPKAEKFQYSFSINFAFPGEKERVIRASCLVRYQGENSPFLILEAAFTFEIEEVSWSNLVDKASHQIRLPKSTARHMMSLLTGAARGILHVETVNTEFNRLILPTINLNEIIDGDIVHSFNTTEENSK